MAAGPGSPFLVAIDRVAAAAVVTVRGELDSHTAAEFDQHLDQFEAATGAVVVDLSGVTFCDSTGVASLIRQVVRGVDLRVIASARVMRTIALTGVGDLLTVARSMDDATRTPPSPTC